jgi:hypothetical protein
MPLRLRGRAERYGHSFNRNKAVIWRMRGPIPGRSWARFARRSTAAFIALNVLKKCFPDRLTGSGWLPKLKEIIPAYGVNLIEDAAACDRVRADTAPVLKIANI